MSGEETESKQTVSFGPFTLRVVERLLETADGPVQLSARALDILTVLVERAGEVVSKKELMARVWPDVTVDESSLRVHIVALRKALGDGQGGARYVTTLSGRGYCFVSPVSQAGAPAPKVSERPAPASHGLPVRLARMVGRDDAIDNIATQVEAHRFVSIVGPGGIGKTSVAISVGHTLLAGFGDAVCYIDLGPLSDPQLVPSAVASSLGLLVQTHNVTLAVLGFLRERRMLLILDSCEHVIETAATLAERIFQEAPQVHILATSRESLRVEGEHVLRLPPLDSPPDDADLTAAQVLAFPAAKLFFERVAASGGPRELSDEDAPMVGEICRRLDGIALAIELAAGRVSVFGIQEIGALLNNRFGLLWEGRRTALLRHQTLRATLDWSYNLLSEPERVALRRMSIFAGIFTLEAARAVAAGPELDSNEVAVALESLVAKSLVSADIHVASPRYRLLDTTRAYGQEKLLDSSDADQVEFRRASYFLELLEQVDDDMPAPSQPESFATHADQLGNVRAALEWCFSARGQLTVGVALAAASTRLFLDMSLLAECHRWSERAIAALDDVTRGSRHEMELHAALGLSLMLTRGNTEQAGNSLTRGLELAEQLGDLRGQLGFFEKLHLFHVRIGNFQDALMFAQRGESVAQEIGDPVGLAQIRVALGISYHLKGDSPAARACLAFALEHLPASQINSHHYNFDYRNRARITLARVLWLQGYPDQAVGMARQALEDTINLDHPIKLCLALFWASSVFLWNKDLKSAEEYNDLFIAQADRYSLAPFQTIGLGARGELLVMRGDVEPGMILLRRSLEALRAHRYGLLTAFSEALAQGQSRVGRGDEALATIDEAIALVEHNGDLFGFPELLRIKADILASMPNPDVIGAERHFIRSLELAGQQSSLAWELRTATSLARLWSLQGRRDEARDVLAPIYARFTEGFESPDLAAARYLLDELRGSR
jgi:predicted ATPase/DNA-binding winged helix-turn-helix (wHTH) protein